MLKFMKKSQNSFRSYLGIILSRFQIFLYFMFLDKFYDID